MSDEPKTQEPVLYVLRRRFHDGRTLHQPGDKLYFIPGKHPTTAVLDADEVADAAEEAEASKAEAKKAAKKAG